MAAKNGKAQATEETGSTYVRVDGQTFKSPKYTAAENTKILENKYVVEGLDDMQMVIFQDDIGIKVVDKNKEEDMDLTSHLTDMVINNPDVALNFGTQLRWRDVIGWGPAITNMYWQYEGSELRLIKTNRLPPNSFARKGGGMSLVYNRLLPGICINPTTKETEFWQTQDNGQVKQLVRMAGDIEQIHMTTNPLYGELGGTPFILPLFPFIKMVNYSWQRQMAKVNQWGDGGMWTVKISNAQGDDVEYAKKILRNQGSTNRYPLRENMSIENFGIGSDGSALETITEIGSQMRRFFIRSDLGKDGGQLVGGTNTAEIRKYISSIKSQHRWLERDIYAMLHPWLKYNGWEEKGYQIIVTIPSPEIDKSEVYLKVAGEARQAGSASENEHRAILSLVDPAIGNVLKPLDDAELAALRERNAAMNPAAAGAQLQKVDVVTRAGAVGVIRKSKARAFVQKTLGMKDGDSADDDGDDIADGAQAGALSQLTKATEDLAAAVKER